MSIAGGLPLAVARAHIHRCETLQIFSKNASQWRARPLPPQEIAAFRKAAKETGIAPVVAHASYLINIATTNPALRAQSIAALGEEVDRAEALGLLGVILHPGARMTAPADEAISLIASALDEVLGKRRLAVCLDTCHLLAAGYDLCTEVGYRTTFETFGRLIGFDKLKVFHLNDSKKPCMSRVDRHEHIGRGCLGLEPFRRLLNDPRFANLPMILETEKSDWRERGKVVIDPLDQMNLNTLRSLRVS
jgi:deoxyribonuclease-4